MAALATLVALPGLSQAATVTLVTTDAAGQSSFLTDTLNHWNPPGAPVAGNAYVVPGGAAGNLVLRTLFDTGNTTFAGDSLTLGDNTTNLGILTLKNATGAVITVNNLTLNKGSIQNGGNSAGAATALTVSGNGITLGTGGGTIDSGAAGRTINVTSAITGAGPLSIIGGGIITLSGTNNYTGTTTVSTGATLTAVDGVGLSSNSALVLGGGSLVTSGTFVRGLGTGAGQVSLTGAAGFTSNGGNLVVALGGTAAPTPLTVGAGGFAPTSLFLNNGSGTGTVDFRNSVDLAGATTYGITVANTTAATAATDSGSITDSVGTGTFTKSGAGLLILTGNNTYAGTTAINGGTLRASGTALSNANINFNGGLLGTSGAFTRTLGTGAGQVQWTGAATALGGFSAEGGDLTVTLNNDAVTPLVWGTTAGFNPGSIVVGGAFATNTTTLTNNIDLSTATTAITRTLVTQAGTGVVSGVISNTGAAQGTLGIEGNGTATGTLILSGTNTYGGTTVIDTGSAGGATVRATNSAAFGTSLIQFTAVGNATTARLELANNINVANNINLTARNNLTAAIENVSDTNTLGGTINLGTGGNAYIIQSDSGLLTLTGASGSTPGTAIQAGTGVTGTRTVTLQGVGNGVVSGLIANNAATVPLFKSGTGTWTLTAANTFSGPVSLFGGLLSTNNLANGGSNSGIGASANAAGNVQLIGGGLQYTGAAVSTDRLITIGNGGGTLDASGTGAVTFNNTGANVTADGPTNGTTVSGNNTVTVTAGNLAGVAVGQAISGTGIPTGTTVTAINYNAGTVTLSANATAAGTGVGLTFGSTAARTLTLTGTNTGLNTLAGTLANSAAGTVLGVAKTGPGTWVTSGANTYTGATTVTGGTLRVANATAISNVLTNAGGAVLGDTGGRLVLDYTGGSSPVGQVKTILDAEFAGNFATGQVRATLTGNHTLGYGDNGSAVTIRTTLPGDADLDGDVDFNDFLALQSSFGTAGTRFDQGNFNYDGATNFNDFLLLQGNFGQTIGFDAAVPQYTAAEFAMIKAITSANQVPEPASLSVLGLGAAALIGRRRRAR